MRTELKIGVTVLLVVSVMALLYFVFFAGEPPKKQSREDVGPIAGSSEPNLAPARGDRGGRASRPPGRGGIAAGPSPTPAPAPARTETPSVAVIPPVSLVPAASPRPAVETIAMGEPRPTRPTPEPAATPRPDTAVIPPITILSPPAPSPRAAEPGRASPAPFEPTPIYVREPPRVETIAPVVVDDRPRLTPVGPGMVEANAAAGPRTGLVRKADGKDYYVVLKDDKGYWGIAAKPFVYGDGRKWDLIAKANPNADPARLQIGQELVIPPLVRVSEARPIGSGTTRPAGAHGQYVIKAGDTLEAIARSQYGDGSLWHAIAKANPGVDPSRLKIGQEIVIPPVAEVRPPAASPAPGATSRPAVTRRGAPGSSPAPAPTERPTPARTTPPGWD